MEILDFVKDYGAFAALPVVVAGVTQGLKNSFKTFFRAHHVGMRLLPFIPLVLGVAGGFLLPVATLQEKILIGGALGQLSALIYKGVTRGIASKAKLLALAESRGEEE